MNGQKKATIRVPGVGIIRLPVDFTPADIDAAIAAIQGQKQGGVDLYLGDKSALESISGQNMSNQGSLAPGVLPKSGILRVAETPAGPAQAPGLNLPTSLSQLFPGYEPLKQQVKEGLGTVSEAVTGIGTAASKWIGEAARGEHIHPMYLKPEAQPEWWTKLSPEEKQEQVLENYIYSMPIGGVVKAGAGDIAKVAAKNAAIYAEAKTAPSLVEQMATRRPKLTWRGKTKQWITDQLQVPPGTDPPQRLVTTTTEAALDRLNRNLKRDWTEYGPQPTVSGAPYKTFVNPATGETASFGNLPFDVWTKENVLALSANDLMEARNWYKKLYELFAKNYGKKQALQELRTWALSQKRASPSLGMMNVWRAKDIALGLPKIKKAGLAEGVMIQSIQQEIIKKGVGQKLSDFLDSALGKKYRSLFKNDPRGGSPAAIDIWAYRDIGYLDETTLENIAKIYGDDAAKQFSQWSGAMDEASYEFGSKYYNELADYLNANNIAGGGWDAKQVQAVGWIRIQQKLGEIPETPEMIFTKNYYTIPTELDFGKHSPASQLFPEFWTLQSGQNAKITKYVLDQQIDDIARLHNVQVVKAPYSVGGYTDVKGPGAFEVYPGAPNRVIEVIGSPESVDAFRDSVGYALHQTEMLSSRIKHSGNRGAIDIISKTGRKLTQAEVLKVGYELQKTTPIIKGQKPLISGHTTLPSGDGITLYKKGGRFSDAELHQIDDLITQVNVKYKKDFKGRPYHVELKGTKNDWSKAPQGEIYKHRISGTGRSDLLPALEDYHRRTIRLTQEAFEKYAPDEYRQFLRERGLAPPSPEPPINKILKK